MRPKILCWLLGVLALIVGPVSLALADYTITVTIGDTTLTQTNNPVNIAGTYTHAATGGQITIANSGGTAQVLLPNAGQDGILDSIKLVYARITANNASVTNFPLSFQAQMTQGPNTPQSTVFYKMTAVGVFQVNAGSSFAMGDYLKNPSTDGFTFLQQATYTPGNVLMQLTPGGVSWPPPGHVDLSGDRLLRVDTAIQLANGRFLDFNTGANPSRYILMYNDSSPDQCTTGRRKCEHRTLYLPCAMKGNECYMKNP